MAWWVNLLEKHKALSLDSQHAWLGWQGRKILRACWWSASLTESNFRFSERPPSQNKYKKDKEKQLIFKKAPDVNLCKPHMFIYTHTLN